MHKRFSFLLFLLLAFVAQPFSFSQSTVRINEFIASNGSSVANMLDEDGEASDWIELHNSAATAVNIGGWRLTDDPALPAQWVFPATASVPARGYLLVYASGKNRTSPRLHVNFSLAAGGEYLALSKPDGEIVSEFEFDQQIENVSYGYDSTGALRYFQTPTPNAANGTGFVDVVDGPKFSVKRGFYNTPFTVTLQTDTPEATIRYTTDGVQPTATVGTIYTGAIQITGTTTLRAVAYRQGWQSSQSETHSYFFVSDIIRQAASGAAPSGWPTSWGANVVNYGMDPDIVNSAQWGPQLTNALLALPTYSVVMRLGDLFSNTNGIYANPGQDGRAWERPCSVELIYPDGRDGFQQNAGIRIRGGFSRSTGNPKHAFRLFFRDEYGAGKLQYPVFGPDAAQEFDNFDLRTFQNYSWSFQGDSSGNFMRDVFSRDTQLAMSRPGERGDYVHLYINGQYWGIYNTCERPEASYGEVYFGGNKDDYDVVKVEAGSYDINATDGNLTAWRQLYDQSKLGYTNNTEYFRIQGRNPDGTVNTNYPVLVDMPNLIDYMLVILFGGNLDAPISNFLGNNQPNNWYGIRNRLARDGFRFVAHDSEHTMLDINADRTGPYAAGENNFLDSNPQWVWQKLQANAEFRMVVADHVHRHFFNNGVFTSSNALARVQKRMAELDLPVIAESARWGDAHSSRTQSPLTKANWLNAASTATNFAVRRGPIVLQQMRADNLYPAVVAPVFSQHGGAVQRGHNLSISGSGGTVYYTLDGTDPRVIGGDVRPGARAYSGPIALTENATVKSRVRSSTGVWSALNEADFVIIQNYTELVISEIMYHAADEGAVSGDELDFIELKNTSNRELDLSGVHFTTGITFTFPNGTRLGPGQFIVLVENQARFAAKYPNVRISGVYVGQLSNGGEKITLTHAAGGKVGEVTYSDAAPWPRSADGGGFSLTLVNPNVSATPTTVEGWRASSAPGGSPGADDPVLNVPLVWVTEVLTHTDAPALDTVELHNPGIQPADISGWFLTDSRSNPKKFRIPNGTIIPAGGYILFDESAFNNAADPNRFSFSSHGEEVYLFSADAAGNLTGFSDGFAFGGAANGVSFGRHVSSVGEIFYPAQRVNSFGAANIGPRLGPVIINELRYSNANAAEEFIEIKNISDATVSLFDPQNPANTWSINGVGFQFPTNIRLQPGEIAVVVNSDVNAFRVKYGIAPSVQIFGPFSGNLQDGGENIELLRPDAPDVTSTGTVIPLIVVDAVRYDDDAPWPINQQDPDFALERVSASSFGSDPASWRASGQSVSPGQENDANRPPRVNAGADLQINVASFPAAGTLAGTALDDGKPAALSLQWKFVNGPGPVRFAAASSAATVAYFPGTGVYTLRLEGSDGQFTTSDEVVVQVTRPTVPVVISPARSVWKYLDNGTDQGTAWRALTFNDTAWASGPGILGYSDSPNTTISFGADANAKHITYYFRRKITIQNAATVQGLRARLIRDDGAVVYINNREVMRNNMPEGAIGFRTTASAATDQALERTYIEQDVDHTALVTGENIIAVEVHQVSGSSSDLSFDLELVAQTFPSNTSPTVNAGPDSSVVLPNTARLNATVVDDALPLPPGVLTLTWSRLSGPGTVKFSDENLSVTDASFSAPGAYVLRLTAFDGASSTHDDVAVTVTGSASTPFDDWRAANFTAPELQNPSISGPDADPDQDGHTNTQEFTAGTNPKNAASVLRLNAVAGASGRLTLQTVAGKTYTVQGRDSLNGGSWVRVVDIEAMTDMQVPIQDPAGGSKRFYRVVTPKIP